MNNLKRISPFFAILGALVLSLSMSCGKGKGDDKNDPATKTPGSSEETVTTEETPETDLVKICGSLTPSKCKTGVDRRCKYDEAAKQCKPASSDVFLDCGAISDPTACAKAKNVATYGCRYDQAKKVCVKNEAPKTIYVWKKLPNMGSADTIGDVRKVVMSQDGNNLYALKGGAPGEAGIWHKAKDGDWELLNSFIAAPKENALSSDGFAIAEEADLQDLSLHGTKDGAAVQKGKQIAILKGSEPVWALDAAKHNAAAADPNKFANIEDLPFTFSAVVDTKDGQALLFQQGDSDKKNLLFQSTEDLAKSPIAMPLSTSKKVTIGLRLYAAANDGEGGLMLGGENFDVAGWTAARVNKWGVHHILAAHNNPGQPLAGETNSPQDEGVLFSSLLGAIWPNDVDAMTLVGKFGQYYFANRNGTVAGKTLGGLFTHMGAQVPTSIGAFGTSPVVTFDTSKITGTNLFGGVFRVIARNNGLLGVKADLTPDKDNNFSFNAYRDKLEEMMADDRNQAIELSDANDKSLMDIVGDDNLSYFVVKGSGIFSRTKEQGQPRLK